MIAMLEHVGKLPRGSGKPSDIALPSVVLCRVTEVML